MVRYRLGDIALVMLFLQCLLACGGMQKDVPPAFVPGGVIHTDETAGGTPIGATLSGMNRWFLSSDWKPGDSFSHLGVDWQAPQQADCAGLFHVDLGDVRRHIAQGGAAPDTAMAWSPSGRRLAIGSFLGEVLVVDGWNGEVQSRRTFSETMVKHVLWSKEGDTLYVAEQSPSGTVSALDPDTLNTRWAVDLSDFVESSPLPAGNIYGVYTLPAAYALELLDDGSLFVVATHAWNDSRGTRQNRSQILRLDPTGALLNVWPAEPTDAVMFRALVSGGNAVIPVSRSSSGVAPKGMPVGGALIFNLNTFSPASSIQPEPLTPWFTNTFLWEAIDIDGDDILLGLGDGRVGLWSTEGLPGTQFPSGTPMQAGPVPIVASVGSAFLHGERAIYQTSWTHIPFGAAAPDLRPPTAHPRANTIFIADHTGALIWSWNGPHVLEGISLSDDQQTLIAGASTRVVDSRQDLFGILLFDVGPPADPNAPSLERFCATKGPVFFRTDSTVDGRIAVSEHPHQQGQEPAFGNYQVTVFR
jgi:hypothetical protein